MKILVISILGFLVSGCVPMSFKYRYISFEKIPNIQILTYEKSEVNSLKFHGPMASRYQLERNLYTLFLNIDKHSKRPSVFIKLQQHNGINIMVKGVSISNCGGFDSLHENGAELRYEWWGFIKQECLRANTDEQIISFQVLNEEGNILKEEKLPFILKENGIYFENDAT